MNMGKIQLLWIAITVPSKKIAHAGGQTFRYYFQKFVDSQSFDIKLVGMDDGVSDDDIREDLRGLSYKIFHKNVNKLKKISNIESTINIWNKHAGFLSNYYAASLLKLINEYKGEGFSPDLIILESTGVVLLTKEIKQIFPKAKIIASEHDVSYIGWERKANYYKGIKGAIWHLKFAHEKKLEIEALKICDLVMPQNPDNCKLLEMEGIDHNKLCTLVPYFHNMNSLQRGNPVNDILFFGAMGRPENYLSAIWFIDNVMPLLRGKNVRFVVLGSNPPAVLKEYESDNIIITGFVEDIEPYFQNSLCMVAPLVLGAGIKVKILEGMSTGIPVLTNTIGIEGIPAKNNKEYFFCESAEDYANIINRLINGQINIDALEKNIELFMKSYDLEKSYIDFYKRSKELVREK